MLVILIFFYNFVNVYLDILWFSDRSCIHWQKLSFLAHFKTNKQNKNYVLHRATRSRRIKKAENSFPGTTSRTRTVSRLRRKSWGTFWKRSTSRSGNGAPCLRNSLATSRLVSLLIYSMIYLNMLTIYDTSYDLSRDIFTWNNHVTQHMMNRIINHTMNKNVLYTSYLTQFLLTIIWKIMWFITWAFSSKNSVDK